MTVNMKYKNRSTGWLRSPVDQLEAGPAFLHRRGLTALVADHAGGLFHQVPVG